MPAARPRVLIVEDNHVDTMLIVDVLNVNLGDVEVLHAEDGERALELIRSADPPPDVIVLDLNLPKLRGQQVLEQVRQEGLCKDARILVLTSSQNLAERDRVLALGAHRFATKPSVLREFIRLGSVIGELLNEVRGRAEGSSAEAG